MEKFDSISHFLQSGNFEYRVYDMGRKVWEIPNAFFSQIENQQQQYPYPFQQKAWLALLFWPKSKQNEAVIWFLQFPVDELGFLKQASRDAFLIDLLEQTGKNIQSKQSGKAIEDGLGESPFAFKPKEDRLAIFHAMATKVLGQKPSQHYQYAHDYLLPRENGGPGLDQWQFLGLQGLADVVARLSEDDNESLLVNAINDMPDVPLSSYSQALENIEISKALFTAFSGRISTELNESGAKSEVKNEINIPLLASLIRAISSYPTGEDKIQLLVEVLSHSISAEIEIIAAISGRSWVDLETARIRQLFIEKLAQQEQMAFSAILADLMMMPGMRERILEEMRSENRSAELTHKFGMFMQGVTE